MKNKFALILLFLFTLFAFVACGAPQDGQYAALAKCLTKKGVKFYGTFWCPHCQEQKAIFGDDIRYIDYVECDPRDPSAKPQECQEKKIDRYPSWFFPGQGVETGIHTPEELAKKVGCEATPGTQAAAGTEQGGKQKVEKAVPDSQQGSQPVSQETIEQALTQQ